MSLSLTNTLPYYTAHALSGEEYSNNAIAVLTICKADKHNSLNKSELSNFIQQLEAIEKDPAIRVVIITGEGDKTFCAGASFEHIKDSSLRGDAFSALAEKIHHLAIPSICLINGNLYGGGVELALACDFRCAIEDTHLQVPIAKLGLSYSEFGLRLYQAKLGVNASKRILLLAEKLATKELKSLGFIDYVSSDLQSASDQCFDLAKQLLTLSPLSVNTMRTALNGLAMQEFDAKQFRLNENICYQSADKQEGFSALLEKRAAIFKEQ